MILRGCGEWILIETQQQSSSGIIMKSDNKGTCLSASDDYNYLIDLHYCTYNSCNCDNIHKHKSLRKEDDIYNIPY